ncbi:hypothetical protein [Bordetella hinzii]|uniref:hypothetical protein n=1 Tax=Bordetella hinzii TaxID=103855 RepID=UPI0009B8B5A7|nr:hypothetical protein [Bordetella hinzii]QDJ35680.1 hypothetical protein CBR67_02900 [Bordetella hinzii]VEH32207.1 Uncharacterised protein [Bordetella hinzii]
MGLVNSNTRWALFLSASSEPEPRHILDLVFGLQCLEAAGVQPASISIYVDGSDRSAIAQWFSLATQNVYEVHPASQFFLDLAVNIYDNLVLFVTGHGNINGIDGQPPIKPYALIRGIKEAPRLQRAVVYLGQCHAGIFNYIGAGRRLAAPDAAGADIILLGATSLHESISSSTQEQFRTGPVNWLANLFLLHVFKWISSPFDVDGDGRCTVIDSYKYAGVHSNTSNKSVKASAFLRCMDLHQRWAVADQAHRVNPSNQTLLTLQGLQANYNAQLDLHAIHQECWILNAIPAQDLEY